MIRDMKNTRLELNEWLEKEDAIWLQRPHVDWFQSGDRNTKFFHAKALALRNKNLIEGLLDSDDVWQEEDSKVEEIVVDYYQNLFTSSNPVDFDEIIQVVQPKVAPEMNLALTKDFTIDEVRIALKQMYPLKAPGLDGMPPLFF